MARLSVVVFALFALALVVSAGKIPAAAPIGKLFYISAPHQSKLA